MISENTFKRLLKAKHYDNPEDGSGDHAGIKIIDDETEKIIFDEFQKNQGNDENHKKITNENS